MNLHPFHYRQVARKDFSRDAYGRLISFERTFHDLGVRPGTTFPLVWHAGRPSN